MRIKEILKKPFFHQKREKKYYMNLDKFYKNGTLLNISGIKRTK